MSNNTISSCSRIFIWSCSWFYCWNYWSLFVFQFQVLCIYSCVLIYCIFILKGLGATVCYWWALTLLRSWAEKKMESKRIFQAINLSVQDQAFKLIVICRLSPILPSAVLNYLFATMGVSYPMYLGATVVGVAPLAILYAYIGSLAEDLASAFGDEGSTLQSLIILGFFIGSTVLLCIFLAWVGKREIKKALKKLDEIERLKEEEEGEGKGNDTNELDMFSAGEEERLLKEPPPSYTLEE